MSGSLNGIKTDAIGEIFNVSMGSAANAVSGMIGATVSIINPAVSVCKAGDVAPTKIGSAAEGFLFDEGKNNIYVKYGYGSGISGSALIVLNSNDMQQVVNTLMGMPPEIDEAYEFDDMKLSAVTEVMSQMLGASATSMAQMLNTAVEISAPETCVASGPSKPAELLGVPEGDNVCAIVFDFKADDFINSKFAVLLPESVANDIAVMLVGDAVEEAPASGSSNANMSSVKIDAIGEIQNIMMGSAATALSNFMSAKVWITTPVVEVVQAGDFDFAQLDPSICVKINYVLGIHGASFLVLKQSDVQLMVNQLMGLPMEVTDDFEFNELNISAVCEIMNQMMGASATTISEIISTPTDISTPEAVVVDSADDILTLNNIEKSDEVCAISFDLTIDGVIKSKFVTMLSIELANEMGDKMLHNYYGITEDGSPIAKEEPAPAPAPAPPKPQEKPKAQAAPPPAPKKAAPKPAPAPAPAAPMTTQAPVSAGFQEYDEEEDEVDGRSFLTEKQYNNLKSLLDVPMEVTVRIGQTSKSIDEVGNFTRGTIIELDTLANEPVDIIVNGNLIAKGDVVVVDDNFAVRITEIIKAK